MCFSSCLHMMFGFLFTSYNGTSCLVMVHMVPNSRNNYVFGSKCKDNLVGEPINLFQEQMIIVICLEIRKISGTL